MAWSYGSVLVLESPIWILVLIFVSQKPFYRMDALDVKNDFWFEYQFYILFTQKDVLCADLSEFKIRLIDVNERGQALMKRNFSHAESCREKTNSVSNFIFISIQNIFSLTYLSPLIHFMCINTGLVLIKFNILVFTILYYFFCINN